MAEGSSKATDRLHSRDDEYAMRSGPWSRSSSGQVTGYKG